MHMQVHRIRSCGREAHISIFYKKGARASRAGGQVVSVQTEVFLASAIKIFRHCECDVTVRPIGWPTAISRETATVS